jgi:predicted nucleic acid-binding protein
VDRLTTRARENKVQIIYSQWGINETVRVLDGLYRKNKIDYVKFQRAIASIAERVEHNSSQSNFFIAEVNNLIVIVSSYLISEFHISADDALHFATALFYKCRAFVLDDKSFKNRIIKNGRIAVFDLSDQDDIEILTRLCELD